MQHILKNGHFFERRRMFVQAPFHNMKSYVPLDWSAQQVTTQQLQRVKNKQSKQHENLRKNYNQQVDRRLRGRYAGYSSVDPVLPTPRNEDILSKEIQNFNNSKLNTGDSSRVIQETRQFGLQYQPLQNTELEHPNTKVKNKRIKHYQIDQQDESSRLPRTKGNREEHQFKHSNPEMNGMQNYAESNFKHYDQSYPYTKQEKNSSYVEDRYRSLQIPRNPAARQNLSKLVQQLYTGSKVEQYPFRNIMPDKLQNHLREKTKADRKHAYQVTLNLFKH